MCKILFSVLNMWVLIETFLQAAIVKDSSISVSRVSWSPDGDLIGMSSDIKLAQSVHIHFCLRWWCYCRDCIYKTFDTFACLPWAQ